MYDAGITIVSWPTDGDTDANKDAYLYTTDVTISDNVFYDAWTDERDADGTTPEKAPGVILNRVLHCLAEKNSFIRMAGSGLWSTQTYDLNFTTNFVAYSRRVTDSCLNHVDIQNDDSIFEYNIGYKNEGGFFESMGYSDNIIVRYCLSIDAGQEDMGDGERDHHANTVFLTGYAGDGERMGPSNITLHNNLVISTNGSNQYYRYINDPRNILFANNEFILGGGGVMEQLSEVGTNYEQAEVVAVSNLIGGNSDSIDAWEVMHDVSKPGYTGETSADMYAALYNDVMTTYLDETEPSDLSYDEIRTRLCAVNDYTPVTELKTGMSKVALAADSDLCGRDVSTGDFIGAIRYTEVHGPTVSPTYSVAPSAKPTMVPTTTPICMSWCASNPTSWNTKCSWVKICGGCDSCSSYDDDDDSGSSVNTASTGIVMGSVVAGSVVVGGLAYAYKKYSEPKGLLQDDTLNPVAEIQLT
mmetsp:Transcript_29626/g.40209  ORF Transcript_29626/g.40209 Transcript_29626/m.40209 type:complete len:471 (-) Transcript_29626:221-1633(-)